MFQLQLFWKAPRYALEGFLPLCFREFLSIGHLLVGCSHGSSCAVGEHLMAEVHRKDRWSSSHILVILSREGFVWW